MFRGEYQPPIDRSVRNKRRLKNGIVTMASALVGVPAIVLFGVDSPFDTASLDKSYSLLGSYRSDDRSGGGFTIRIPAQDVRQECPVTAVKPSERTDPPNKIITGTLSQCTLVENP